MERIEVFAKVHHARRGMNGALLLLVACSTAGLAQSPGQSAQHDELRPRAAVAHKLAKCILGRARAASTRLVMGASAADSPGERSAIERAISGCMSARDASLTLSEFDLRGDVAEQLLTENESAVLERARSAAPIAPRRLASQGADATSAVMSCAVAAQPGDAAAMIAAPAETAAEMTGFRNLAPALSACVPADFELHLKTFQIRRLVAIALYQLASHASAKPLALLDRGTARAHAFQGQLNA